MKIDHNLLQFYKWINERYPHQYTLDELRNLKILDLGSMGLDNVPDSIQCLENLEVLNLKDNNLSKLPSSIKHLTKLEELYIQDNNLKKIPKGIKNLPNLRVRDFVVSN